MTPVQPEVIRRKLSIIAQNLRALESITNLTVDAYRQNLFQKKGAERLLQELIEAAIDINLHLMTQTGGTVPDDYHQSFLALGENKVIPMELARQLAPSAGLRNRLVHEYDAIDDARVLQAVAACQQQFPLYMKAVEDYLKRLP